MAAHNDLGKWGENIAADYLKNKGYAILERNWRFKTYEIDIIARTKTEIIFVEVKTRSDDNLMLPEDAVDFNKQCRLTSGAQAYINYNRINLEPRFDVISIVKNNTRFDLRHLENAFLPTSRRRRY